MRLHRVDLNTLLVFDALVEQRSVSKAARQLNVSQPAISAALGRLREHFEDPLFVRSGSDMVPTDLAGRLATPVREMLLRAETIVRTRGTFDPTLTPRRFTVSVSDYTMTVLIPQVLRLLQQEAPQVQLTLRHTPFPSGMEMQPTTEALERRQHDFTVTPSGCHSERHRVLVLIEDEFVCIARRDHPAVRRRLTLDQYQSLDHVVAEYDDGRINFIDVGALARAGVQRRIGPIVDRFTAVCELVACSDCLATLPRRMALRMAERLPLKVLPVPFPLPPLTELLQWKPIHDADPGMQWMRDVFQRAAALS